MATAFTPNENMAIKQTLKTYARKYMMQYGIKKTSVDQLVAAANISKGSFYKFYPTKELLFFEVIEESHQELYLFALDVLKKHGTLPIVERLTETILDIFHFMRDMLFMPNMENELNYLMRKLPPDILNQHMKDETSVFERILMDSGINLSIDSDLLATIVHIFTLIHCYPPSNEDAHYEEALRIIVHGFSRELVDNYIT